MRDLDREVRAELRSLPKGAADTVARHLVAAGRFLDSDPARALEHAQAARQQAARIASVREAVGIAAYHTGDWKLALSELRAWRRFTGSDAHLAVIADSERALGRPEKAIELASSPEAARLDVETRVELLIVAAGARQDQGDVDAALASLEVPELRSSRPASWLARLRYAYAELLLAAGRSDEAREWFVQAADVDADGVTDADERVLDLDGFLFTDDGDDDDADDDVESPSAEAVPLAEHDAPRGDGLDDEDLDADDAARGETDGDGPTGGSDVDDLDDELDDDDLDADDEADGRASGADVDGLGDENLDEDDAAADEGGPLRAAAVDRDHGDDREGDDLREAAVDGDRVDGVGDEDALDGVAGDVDGLDGGDAVRRGGAGDGSGDEDRLAGGADVNGIDNDAAADDAAGTAAAADAAADGLDAENGVDPADTGGSVGRSTGADGTGRADAAAQLNEDDWDDDEDVADRPTDEQLAVDGAPGGRAGAGGRTGGIEAVRFEAAGTDPDDDAPEAGTPGGGPTAAVVRPTVGADGSTGSAGTGPALFSDSAVSGPAASASDDEDDDGGDRSAR